MTKNMRNLDRGLRAFVVAPAAFIAAVLVGAGSVVGIPLFALAGVMLATSAVGFCPLYVLVHINTSGRRPRRSHAPRRALQAAGSCEQGAFRRTGR